MQYLTVILFALAIRQTLLYRINLKIRLMGQTDFTERLVLMCHINHIEILCMKHI